MATRDRILDAAESLVLQRGFAGTTVDAVLASAAVSKGAFFHHFPSKHRLGMALVERYAQQDLEILETFMGTAEEESEEPGRQLVEFLRLFEEAASDTSVDVPGCLFVPFVYEQVSKDINDVIVGSIELWRDRILAKLEAAAAARPLTVDVDLHSLADQVFTTIEGGFILTRAVGDPTSLAMQLGHLRTYMTLLLDLTA